MFDPNIFSTASATMAAIQQFAARGSHHYVSGTVEVSAAQRLAHKFHERYELAMSMSQREHARRRGRATFRLVMWPLAGMTTLHWWVLRTDGAHPILGLETWRDAREKRIEWPWNFELVRMPVPPAARQNYRRADGNVAINDVTWTWRFQRQEMDAMRATIRHLSQHRDERLSQLLRRLHSAPGFRQIRSDVLTLDRYVVEQCRRRHREPPPIPPLPRPYIRGRGKSAAAVPLSWLARRAQRGAGTWFSSERGEADTAPEPSSTETENAPEIEAADDRAAHDDPPSR